MSLANSESCFYLMNDWGLAKVAWLKDGRAHCRTFALRYSRWQHAMVLHGVNMLQKRHLYSQKCLADHARYFGKTDLAVRWLN